MDYILYFILTIGILVTIHEFGHFAAARLSGMRTDVFSIGFGKRICGWNKVQGFTWGKLPEDVDLQGHTDYRLAILPLGGYVKVAGMVDESFDTEFADKPPQPWEFRAKSTPKKVFVLIAGVLMNLLLTIAIFWGINYFQGKQVIQTTEIGVIPDSTSVYNLGFRSHDKILQVNKAAVTNWDDVMQDLVMANTEKVTVEVLRNGKTVTLSIPTQVIRNLSQKGMFLPIGNTLPAINAVMDNSPAEDAGLKDGDIFLSINNEPVKTVDDVIRIVSSHKDKTIPITVLREKDTLTFKVTPSLEGMIGVALANAYTGKITYKKYGAWESFVKSLKDIENYTVLTYEMFAKVISGKIAFGSAFGGPVKIAKFAVKSAEGGWVTFLYFLAALSLSLAIINIIPFPGLDGGHLVIVLIEGAIKRELPIKAKMLIQNIGFVLLLIAMAYIIYSDLISM